MPAPHFEAKNRQPADEGAQAPAISPAHPRQPPRCLRDIRPARSRRQPRRTVTASAPANRPRSCLLGRRDPPRHRELRSFFTTCFSAGGIGLQRCTVTDDGVRCALEYKRVRWGSHDLPPQAGIGVYDDVEAPIEHP